MEAKRNKLIIDGIFIFSIVWILYVIINGSYAVSVLRFDAHAQIKGIFKMIKLISFIPLGYFFKKREQDIPTYLLLACIGILVGLILNQDWSKWMLMIKGLRSGSNKWWYLIMGLYSSTGLIISFFLKNMYNNKKILYVVIMFFILAFFHFTIVSQSRTIWFGLIATIFVLIVLKFIIGYNFKNQINNMNKKGFILIMIVFLMLLFFSKTIVSRIVSPDTPILSGNPISKIDPLSSFGLRIQAWKFSLEKFKQRPLLGWGIGTRITKELKIDNKYKFIKKLSHVHSFYLDLLVKTGIIGTFIFISLNILLYFRFFKIFLHYRIREEIALILISTIILDAIFCTTTTRLLHYDWRVYYVFFNGIIYSFVLKYKDSKKAILFSS